MSQTTSKIEAEVNAVIVAPTASHWPKVALALRRGCVDAAHDAELLRRACNAVLGRV
ncbi:hypothetical protein [Cupriavidus sp. CP313]